MNIPALNLPFFRAQMLAGARPTLATYKEIFDAYDHRPGNEDRSNCEWISSFCGGAIGWMSKLSIDADGREVEAGYRDGEQLDPDSGQNDTSLHFADGKALDSEGCPYYVLPGGSFRQASGLKLGDVGVLLYRGVLTAVVLGDIGPTRKIGEASIRAHLRLHPAAPDPCARRDAAGRCTLIRNSSIESGVIAIFFLGSALPGLLEETAQEQIEARAFTCFRAIGGILPAAPAAK
jgi:hypothetical protein